MIQKATTRERAKGVNGVLIKRLQRRDEAALGEVIDRLRTKMFGLCCRIMPDESSAEEAYWFAIWQIWRKAKTFKFKSQFESWVYRLTSNCCFMIIRRDKNCPVSGRKTDLADSAFLRLVCDIPELETPLDLLEEKELLLAFKYSAISWEEKEQITLRVLGWDNLGASEKSCVSIASVKSRLHRGKARLKEELKKYGY